MEVFILCCCAAVLLGIVNYFSLVRPRMDDTGPFRQEPRSEAWWSPGGSNLRVAGRADGRPGASTRIDDEISR